MSHQQIETHKHNYKIVLVSIMIVKSNYRCHINKWSSVRLGKSTQTLPSSCARARVRLHTQGELGALGQEHPDVAVKLGKGPCCTTRFLHHRGEDVDAVDSQKLSWPTERICLHCLHTIAVVVTGNKVNRLVLMLPLRNFKAVETCSRCNIQQKDQTERPALQ